MKFLNKYILLGALTLSMGLTSCTDYLDKSPESDISSTDAFKDFKNFQGFTEELYYCIPDFTNGYWTNSWNWGEDEIINTGGANFHFGYKVDQGDFWGWQSEHDGWQAGWLDRGSVASFNPGSDRFGHSLYPGCMYGIRKANLGLANIDNFKGTKEEKDLLMGQLYFFRAWFHFQLIQYLGGLPYIDRVLPADEVLNLPRETYKECADKCAADFRKAADLLPIDWDDTKAMGGLKGKNQLRVTKIAALGYLGKNYLWAASPLMSKGVKGDTYDYDKDYAMKAAQAFGELFETLKTSTSKNPIGLLPFDQYSNNFVTVSEGGKMPGQTKDGSVTEAIFRGPTYGSGWGASRWGQALAYGGSDINDGGVIFLPTANYVNYYGMANGLPLNDPHSGFDKEHPWKGRDPRFYHDIKFDGCRMVKKETTGKDDNTKWRYADLQTGGAFRSETRGSRTGYFDYKFITTGCNKWDDEYGWSPQIHIHIPWMRLADVYLMYAESIVAATGNPSANATTTMTGLQAINAVRDRAGVDPVSGTYSTDAHKFMDEVRRERAVELAFEGHRFNDLRRWLLLDKYPYNIKTSQEFQRVEGFSIVTDKDGNKSIVGAGDEKNEKVSGFKEVQILKRNFTDKHYWLPLKKSDTQLYEGFPQNPGW
ncbi:RagB/SusD family nutrient uptake outer membrane protein [Segatella albensis]|jgi:hypothetical protein|uniref:RagB/SusD family nutrient uptake outer membrane protein n=1 Tax=Segatella albensis TaxID=77768 RepID=UPI000416ED51|nr:RagB/SusD family nutrient uptake outer membrane protein [Segatella albensis]